MVWELRLVGVRESSEWNSMTENTIQVYIIYSHCILNVFGSCWDRWESVMLYAYFRFIQQMRHQLQRLRLTPVWVPRLLQLQHRLLLLLMPPMGATVSCSQLLVSSWSCCPFYTSTVKRLRPKSTLTSPSFKWCLDVHCGKEIQVFASSANSPPYFVDMENVENPKFDLRSMWGFD